jgi:alpha-glucosidase
MNRMMVVISCTFLIFMAGCATDGLSIVGASGSVKTGLDGVTITSPKSQVQVKVIVNGKGRLCYTVERIKPKRSLILEESPMGITIDDTDLGMGVEVGIPEQYSINETYPWRGVHPVAVNNCIGAKIPIKYTDSNTTYTLDVRVFDDGMGYRYVVPGEGERKVSGEASAWNLPDDCQMWYQTALNNYEGFHKKENVMVTDPNVGFPVTIEYPDGTYATITEAGLFAYSGMTLEADGTSVLKGVFLDDESWQETGEISTPWRVTMTGPDLNALVNCDIVHNLCPAPDEELFPDGMETEWIKPGTATWNWWSDSPVAFEAQKEWVDKAAEMNMDYHLVDAGWESWRAEGKTNFDLLKELCDYAKEKGIGIHVWKHWSGLNEEGGAGQGMRRGGFGGGAFGGQQMSRAEYFKACADAGAVGIKVDFMDSESRARINFYTNTLIEAAKFKLMINFHGANKPTGEPRTYPNEMTREGIRGLEYNKWDTLPAHHYASLPFTRYLAGHGDFTPTTFNPSRLKGTTATLQLASAIIITSPLLHWADKWQVYQESKAIDIIKEIPSVWDETVVLPGSEIGELAAFARRKGDDWFVGIINGGDAKSYSLDLSFLGKGTYKCTIIRDVKGEPAQMIIGKTTVKNGQNLDADMEAAGGFVVWLTPQ